MSVFSDPKPIAIGDLVFVTLCDVAAANGKVGRVINFTLDSAGIEMGFSNKKMTDLGGACPPNRGVWLKIRNLKRAIPMAQMVKMHGSLPNSKLSSEPVSI